MLTFAKKSNLMRRAFHGDAMINTLWENAFLEGITLQNESKKFWVSKMSFIAILAIEMVWFGRFCEKIIQVSGQVFEIML